MPATSGVGADLDTTARAVLDQLADGRPLTASEICSATGLARSTVVEALSRLESAAAVQRHVPAPIARGRPPRRWSATRDPGLMMVVVPAAHGTLAGVVSANGRVLALNDQTRSGVGPTPAADVLAMVDATLVRAGVSADDIGLAIIGLPGPSGQDHGSGTGPNVITD